MTTTTTTHEHRVPPASDAKLGEPVLICVFPALVVFPLPSTGKIIGRKEFADSGILDKEISGRHLRFSRLGGVFKVEDVKSRNGTFVNGHAIGPEEPVEMPEGGVVRIGCSLFVFRSSFTGSAQPDAHLGELVSPFGLRSLRQSLEKLANQQGGSVLIEGETGTGKELVAEQIAIQMRGNKKNFAPVNVAAIPASVFESHLFGWKKGAYSGSEGGGEGVIRAHAGGTVFLDEIGELSLDLQPKILRLLEKREVWPVGESKAIKNIDVTFVAATNRSLDAMVEAGTFRLDLRSRFARRLHILPLRERPEDIFAILQTLYQRRGLTLDPEGIEIEAVERLLLFPWKGNVRELELLVTHLAPSRELRSRAITEVLGPSVDDLGKRPLTREQVNQVLRECGGNQAEAARRLGVDRAKLIRLLKKVQAEG